MKSCSLVILTQDDEHTILDILFSKPGSACAAPAISAGVLYA